MPLCASVYMCLVVTCWEKADLLALICGVLLRVCYFPIGILGQVWYLIVSIPDLCTLTYFVIGRQLCKTKKGHHKPHHKTKIKHKLPNTNSPTNLIEVDTVVLLGEFHQLRLVHIYCGLK